MKLKKIAGVYHAQFRTATGARRRISTKQTDREQALAVVKQAGIAEMERSALAGKLSREVVGRILTGKRMTLAKSVALFREWMQSRGRSPKTIAENNLNHVPGLTHGLHGLDQKSEPGHPDCPR